MQSSCSPVIAAPTPNDLSSRSVGEKFAFFYFRILISRYLPLLSPNETHFPSMTPAEAASPPFPLSSVSTFLVFLSEDGFESEAVSQSAGEERGRGTTAEASAPTDGDGRESEEIGENVILLSSYPLPPFLLLLVTFFRSPSLLRRLSCVSRCLPDECFLFLSSSYSCS